MTTSAYPLLTTLRDALGAVAGVQTCKIGLEANMTPADYPMVRIVPSRVADDSVIGRRDVECLIYFGQPIHEFSEGVEALYESLLTMEVALITAAVQTGGIMVQYMETVLDEDRIDAYKLMALRVRVVG